MKNDICPLVKNKSLSDRFFNIYKDDLCVTCRYYMRYNTSISEHFIRKNLDIVNWEVLSCNNSVSESLFDICIKTVLGGKLDKLDISELFKNTFNVDKRTVDHIQGINRYSFDKLWKSKIDLIK